MNKTTGFFLALLLLILTSVVLAESEDIQLTRAGIDYYKAGNYQKAVELFEQAVIVNPDNFQPFQYSAMAYLQLGDRETALLQFERAYNIFPNPKIKKYIDDLKKTVRGAPSLGSYPLTFDLILSLTSGFLHGNSATSYMGSYFSNIGGCALVSFNFNEVFSLASGIICSNKSGGIAQAGSYYDSFIKYSAQSYDFPLYARFRFMMPWSDRNELSLAVGPYLGIFYRPSAVISYYGETSPSGLTGFANSETGVSFFVSTAYYFGKISCNFFELISFGLTNIHPDYDAKTCSIITGMGVGF
jgi:hypothetical protein